MPMDLAFKFTARQGNYYAKQGARADPFNRIQIHPLLNAVAIRQFPFDHAGEGETSLMLDPCPEGVGMRRFSAKRWFTRTAQSVSAETGRRGRQFILAHMRPGANPVDNRDLLYKRIRKGIRLMPLAAPFGG